MQAFFSSMEIHQKAKDWGSMPGLPGHKVFWIRTSQPAQNDNIQILSILQISLKFSTFYVVWILWNSFACINWHKLGDSTMYNVLLVHPQKWTLWRWFDWANWEIPGISEDIWNGRSLDLLDGRSTSISWKLSYQVMKSPNIQVI